MSLPKYNCGCLRSDIVLQVVFHLRAPSGPPAIQVPDSSFTGLSNKFVFYNSCACGPSEALEFDIFAYSISLSLSLLLSLYLFVSHMRIAYMYTLTYTHFLPLTAIIHHSYSVLFSFTCLLLVSLPKELSQLRSIKQNHTRYTKQRTKQ